MKLNSKTINRTNEKDLIQNKLLYVQLYEIENVLLKFFGSSKMGQADKKICDDLVFYPQPVLISVFDYHQNHYPDRIDFLLLFLLTQYTAQVRQTQTGTNLNLSKSISRLDSQIIGPLVGSSVRSFFVLFNNGMLFHPLNPRMHFIF